MKYNKDSKCPKCGESGATSAYENMDYSNIEYVLRPYKGRAARHQCINCGYCWREDTNDCQEKEAT